MNARFEPQFIELHDDPAQYGLPATEAGCVMICFESPQFSEVVTAVVDEATADLVAYASLMPGGAEVPLNLDAVHWLTPGTPAQWQARWGSTRPAWLRQDGTGAWVLEEANRG